jgi:hypothetical protein
VLFRTNRNSSRDLECACGDSRLTDGICKHSSVAVFSRPPESVSCTVLAHTEERASATLPDYPDPGVSASHGPMH